MRVCPVILCYTATADYSIPLILNDPIVTIQFMRLGKQSGIYKYERFIDASNDAQWEMHADEWVRSGIDPNRGSYDERS
jgi:hypothetical protein